VGGGGGEFLFTPLKIIMTKLNFEIYRCRLRYKALSTALGHLQSEICGPVIFSEIMLVRGMQIIIISQGRKWQRPLVKYTMETYARKI